MSDVNEIKTPQTDQLMNVMAFLESMKSVHECLAAYRAFLAGEGYSETAQESMILDVHCMLMRGTPQT